jgi:hypothetical protein
MEGGAKKQTGKGGWTVQFYNNLISILSLLKDLGYNQGVIFDSQEINIIDFKLMELVHFDNLFKDHFEYGNIVLFKNSLDIKNLKLSLFECQNELLNDHIIGLRNQINSLQKKVGMLDYKKRISDKLYSFFKK